jgi:hypothetical protein
MLAVQAFLMAVKQVYQAAQVLVVRQPLDHLADLVVQVMAQRLPAVAAVVVGQTVGEPDPLAQAAPIQQVVAQVVVQVVALVVRHRSITANQEQPVAAVAAD